MSDEAMNATTHGVGLALTGAALTSLGWQDAGVGIYLLSLVSVYLFSLLSHALTGFWKQVFERLDKGCIFFLIAGTYTPLMLSSWACDYTLLRSIWFCAVLGFVVKVFFGVRTIVPYILLGWLPVMLDPLVLVTAPTETFWLVVAGGLAYTFGLVFFMLDRIHGFHAIWHLFVLLGSILHFLAIYGVSKWAGLLTQ